MKNTILRILIGAILFSLISGIVVSIIGLRLGWNTFTQFSDGFFWAGAIMILIGFVSFRGYSLHATNGPPIYLDPADRAKLWAADTFHGQILMAVCGISGLLLFGFPSWSRDCSSPQQSMNLLFQPLINPGST